MLLILISGSLLGCQNNLKNTQSSGFQKAKQYLNSNLMSNFVFLFKEWRILFLLKIQDNTLLETDLMKSTTLLYNSLKFPGIQFLRSSSKTWEPADFEFSQMTGKAKTCQQSRISYL